MGARPVNLWSHLIDRPDGLWSADLATLYAEAQARRNEVKVGSIDQQAMRLLRAISVCLEPRVIVEIGTGLGASTTALRASEAIYTCDKNHDRVPAAPGRFVHPRVLSTDLLRELVDRGLVVDLFFFDGRLQPADIPLILALSSADTTYVVDDYLSTGAKQEKGLANLWQLGPHLPRHRQIEPMPTMHNQIAALVSPADHARLEAW